MNFLSFLRSISKIYIGMYNMYIHRYVQHVHTKLTYILTKYLASHTEICRCTLYSSNFGTEKNIVVMMTGSMIINANILSKYILKSCTALHINLIIYIIYLTKKTFCLVTELSLIYTFQWKFVNLEFCKTLLVFHIKS